jgi:hypothetical protein
VSLLLDFSKPVFEPDDTCLLGAVGAAIDRAAFFDPVSNDLAAAMGA